MVYPVHWNCMALLNSPKFLRGYYQPTKKWKWILSQTVKGMFLELLSLSFSCLHTGRWQVEVLLGRYRVLLGNRYRIETFCEGSISAKGGKRREKSKLATKRFKRKSHPFCFRFLQYFDFEVRHAGFIKFDLNFTEHASTQY